MFQRSGQHEFHIAKMYAMAIDALCNLLSLFKNELWHENINEKITIIGLPGAGKTTLAKKLERIYNIKVYHLDRIFWERGWKGKP